MRPGRQFAYSLCQIGLADRTDVTKILGDNYVRVDRLQFWQIHEIKTPACGCLPSDSLIDFLRRKVTMDQCIHNDGLLPCLRRIVALEGHARDAFAHSESIENLRGGWEKGANLHGSFRIYESRRMQSSEGPRMNSSAYSA